MAAEHLEIINKEREIDRDMAKKQTEEQKAAAFEIW